MRAASEPCNLKNLPCVLSACAVGTVRCARQDSGPFFSGLLAPQSDDLMLDSRRRRVVDFHASRVQQDPSEFS
jgi:hypothetical protein